MGKLNCTFIGLKLEDFELFRVHLIYEEMLAKQLDSVTRSLNSIRYYEDLESHKNTQQQWGKAIHLSFFIELI